MNPETRLFIFVAAALAVQLVLVIQSTRLEEQAKFAYQDCQSVFGGVK